MEEWNKERGIATGMFIAFCLLILSIATVQIATVIITLLK